MSVIKNLLLGFGALLQSTFGGGAGQQPLNLETLVQQVPQALYVQSPATTRLTFLSGAGQPLLVSAVQPAGADAVAVARRFLVSYGALFGIQDQTQELSLVRTQTDELGMQHLAFNQNYQGVPVWGGQLRVHLNNQLEVVVANGEVVVEINLDVNPTVTPAQAQQIALNLWQEQFGTQTVSFIFPQLFVFNPQLLTKEPDKTHLVWEVEGSGQDSQGYEQREFFYINAHTGELVFQLPGIFEARNRRTYDCNQTTSCSLTYQESDNPTGNDEIASLHRFAGNTYDYYQNTHQRDSFNNSGANIVSRGRYSTIQNAFWDGNRITFGPGMAELDVVGHEFTHGVVQYSAGLSGYGQGGALNESYADIFGVAIDKPDWELGEDTTLGAIRDMANPPRFNHPDSFYSNFYYCGNSNAHYVHINNGVNNKAAYLIAQGGNLNNCSIAGIGRSKQEAIFYRALTVYLTASSGFSENYTALIQACADLYGAGSGDCTEVSKAVEATGMDESSPCSGQSQQPPACAGGPTPTASPSPTVGPSPTLTPSLTPTPTSSPGVSPTPSPTGIPNPTPTPTAAAGQLTLQIKFEAVSQDRGSQNVRLEIPVQGLDQSVSFAWNNNMNSYESPLSVSGLPKGIYDIFLTGPAHLRKKFTAIVVDPSQNQTVDLTNQPLLGGDANLDNQVDQTDVGLLAQDYANPSPVFNTDFNFDGQMDSQDVTLLSWNYGKLGD